MKRYAILPADEGRYPRITPLARNMIAVPTVSRLSVVVVACGHAIRDRRSLSEYRLLFPIFHFLRCSFGQTPASTTQLLCSTINCSLVVR